MRALITGVGGFAGSYLAEYCLSQPEVEVIGLVRRRERLGHAAHLAGRIEVLEADLRDAAATARAVATSAPDVVYHLAGQAFVPLAFEDPVGTFESNVVGQLHLIQALLQHHPRARLLVVGSSSEYGRVGPEENPIGEDVPLRPVDPYAVSKVTQDLLGYQYFASHQLQVVRVRPFNHTGPRQSDRFAPSWFAHRVAQIEAGRVEPEVPVGNLSAIRDFTDVRDMVRAYHLAAGRGEAGEVYNLGSGQGRPVSALLDILGRLSRVPFSLRQDATRVRPSDTPELVCDASRFRALTGWTPQLTLEQTLEDLLTYWRRHVAAQAEPPAPVSA